jgi:hypothetical protein
MRYSKNELRVQSECGGNTFLRGRVKNGVFHQRNKKHALVRWSLNAPNLATYAPQARALLCSNAASIDPSPCTCVSACFLIYTGGIARSGNDIHIHRIRFDDNFYGNLSPGEAEVQYRQAMQSVHDYLRDMEIPDSIYEKMVRMPSYTTEPIPGKSPTTSLGHLPLPNGSLPVVETPMPPTDNVSSISNPTRRKRQLRPISHKDKRASKANLPKTL